MIDVQKTFDWLVDGAPGAPTAPEVVERFCRELVAAGVPIDRCNAFVRTLHPHIMGRRFTWKPGKAVEVFEAPFTVLGAAGSPRTVVGAVQQSGEAVRVRLTGPKPLPYPGLDELAAEGFTDFFAAPLPFLSGKSHCMTFATRAPGGWTAMHLAALSQVLRPLSRVAEILALARTAANILDTYVGRDAGERILAGQIQRGHTERIQAVIWFSDLRGFTQLSQSLPPGELIAVLNDLFECQVPAIERHGGEVLKFIGDGLLAILPIEDEARSPAPLCDAALDAARDAFAALEELNARRGAAGQKPIQFGLALHVGEVAYGNIGGSNRLDFTAIGPAVNLASRLEGLTGKLEERVIVSSDFAGLSTRPARSLGRFELKGVPAPVEAFVPQ